MNTSPGPAVIVHDLKRIISANEAACVMFRCEAWEITDRSLLDFVPEEFKDLMRLRLYATARGKGSIVSPRDYIFVRCDGSLFAASVTTRDIGDGMVETTVTYRGEHGQRL